MKEDFVLANGMEGFIELEKRFYIKVKGKYYEAFPFLDINQQWGLQYSFEDEHGNEDMNFIHDKKAKELFLQQEDFMQHINMKLLACTLFKEAVEKDILKKQAKELKKQEASKEAK